MNALNISEKICCILENKKAVDVNLLCIKDRSALADYLVIAKGTSTTHVRALAEEVEFMLKKDLISPNGKEGMESCSWILLDYGDIIVNILSGEAEKFYNIEELWRTQVI